MGDLPGGCVRVAEALLHQVDRLAAERHAVDPHRCEARIGHLGAGQVVEADDGEVVRNTPADFRHRLEHADCDEIVHAEGGGEARVLGKGGERRRMRLDARIGLERQANDPRLAAFLGNHIRFHVARRHATHVSNMELRSLSPERLTEMLRLRSSYEKELRRILRDGADSGAFAIEDAGLTAMAIIQMATGVIVWYRPGERLSVDQVAETYLAMTLRLVGAREDAHVREHA